MIAKKHETQAQRAGCNFSIFDNGKIELLEKNQIGVALQSTHIWRAAYYHTPLLNPVIRVEKNLTSYGSRWLSASLS